MNSLLTKEITRYDKKLYPNIELQDLITTDILLSKETTKYEPNTITTKEYNIGGRITNIRKLSTITFLEVENLQVIVFEEQVEIPKLQRGDIIHVFGVIGTSKTGQLSLYAKQVNLLSLCLETMPTIVYGVKDIEIRSRQRYLDLIFNTQSKNTFITRSKTIKFLRNYLDTYNFVEVETPMLNLEAGGANAKPFITHHNELNLNLSLRIAPELYLKMMIIGGFHKVYELGRVFRNEGIDLTHNPEFTTLEFYMAYKNYKDMLLLVEDIFESLVINIFDTTTINNISFKKPFKQIDFMDELSKQLKDPKILTLDLDTDEALTYLQTHTKANKIIVEKPITTARILDKLSKHFIEENIIQPTFIMNHPKVLCPLAKQHKNNEQLTERFELYINKMEISNAYTELNDPTQQRLRFREQQKFKLMGDQDIPNIDEDFCHALEYGLPPTTGCGIGIDRLVMLLTNKTNIKDVILFPLNKPKN